MTATFINLPVETIEGTVSIAGPVSIGPSDTGTTDAFGRLRISNPFTLFDSKQINGKDLYQWDDQQTSGTGTTSTAIINKCSVRLAVSATTAGTRVIQSFRRMNYQPGKSMLFVGTVRFGAATAGVTKSIGYFDGSDGLYFQQLKTTGMHVCLRSNVTGTPVDTKVLQSNWNLDTLDGSKSSRNPSGLQLDVTKVQICLVDFQYLGSGRVRYAFDIGGDIVYVHEINNANIIDSVYMSTPNLPVRYEISNDGTGVADNFDMICSAVISEGGRENTGKVRAVDTGITPLTTTNTTNIFPVLAIRLNSGSLGADIQTLSYSVFCTTNVSYRYSLQLNPTLTGTALSWTQINAIDVARPTSDTTVSAEGQLYSSGYMDATKQGAPSLVNLVPSDSRLGSNIAGTADILAVCAQNLSNTVEDYYAAITVREEL